jgi:nucleoside-diphosphate-sugar epimerase
VPIFHLGSTEELTILQAAKIILAALGETEDNLEIKDAPLGSVHRRCADISLANHILGWSPKWNFKDGIAHLLTY